MAPSKRKPPVQKQQSDWSFVNYTLTKEDKESIQRWEPESATALDGIASLVADGYKFSLSWDNVSECYVSSLSCGNEKSPNHMKILTARAVEPELCMATVLWKHEVKFDGVWPTVVKQEKDKWG